MTTTRNFALLAGRAVLGSYLAAHGAQKLFGSFGGYGIEATSAGFDRLGLKPGAVFARIAGASELGGGLLTATGALSPLGPITLAGTMAVAAATHRANGAFAAKGGYELALSNMAAALTLTATGPGKFSLDGLTGLELPGGLRRMVTVGAVAISAASLALVLRTPPPAPPSAEPVEASGTSPADLEDAN